MKPILSSFDDLALPRARSEVRERGMMDESEGESMVVGWVGSTHSGITYPRFSEQRPVTHTSTT